MAALLGGLAAGLTLGLLIATLLIDRLVADHLRKRIDLEHRRSARLRRTEDPRRPW